MTMHEFRRMAAAMDLRIQQLTAEGVHGLAVIERMVGHLPDLHRIWVGTSDHQLATLCNDFPGFSRYASLMEEAADVERRKASRPYDDVPELHDSLKDAMAALLVTAATLERSYQEALDADKSPECRLQMNELNKLPRKWVCRPGAFHLCFEEIGCSEEDSGHLR
jgi:phosphoglycolate phosphatase-like HAD superfamily hydrolase